MVLNHSFNYCIPPYKKCGVLWYEPFAYTNHATNKGRFTYPGMIENKEWNHTVLREYLQPVTQFQKIYHIPAHRILVGEFGGHRTAKGLPHYFKDLSQIFHDKGWHFAFYAFREDIWDGMDYELGDQRLPASYWQAIDKGQNPVLKRSPDTPTFKPLLESLQTAE